MSLLRTLAFIAGLCALPAAADVKAYPFRMDTRQEGREYTLVAVNDGPARITLSASIKGENVASNRNWPLVVVVRPHSTQEIARVYAATPGLSFRFNTRYSHHYGDALTAPDASVAYRVPFADGQQFQVGQAFGGEITTHTEPDSQYAVDITIPEGTPIVAARSGTVIETVDGFVEGGRHSDLLKKANSISIQHADGSTAAYVHLMPNGILVRPGQTVQTGQTIGYSGNTGYSSGPHLHFAVSKAVVAPDGTVTNVSIPVLFQAFNPPVRFAAQQNMLLAANYATPGIPASAPAVRPAPVAVAPSPRPAPGVSAATGNVPTIPEIEINPEAVRKARQWLDEIQAKTGYPWWMWLCSIIAGILLLRLAATFRETGPLKRQEPTLGWHDHTSTPEASGRKRSK